MSGKIKTPPTPEYPDLDAEILRTTSADERSQWPRLASSDYRDARVAAAFVVCPSLGWMLSDDSLAAIERPIGVRWAEADQIVAAHEIEERYVRAISTATGATVGQHVSHYDFIADNTHGHPVRESVAIDAVAFFNEHLAHMAA